MAKPAPVCTTVLIPALPQDPLVVADPESKVTATDPIRVRATSGFSDGPACRRLAVVDIDAATGRLRPPAKLIPNAGVYRNVGTYQLRLPQAEGLGRKPHWAWGGAKDREGVPVDELTRRDYADPFIKVSAFAHATRTISLVEGPAALARRVDWAFHGDQLLLVPSAGEMANAFYHRGSRSLLLFDFAPAGDTNRVVRSALSQDIVCHETAHALIDGIAPDLYHAITPQSLAIHEAAADITSMLLALLSREIPRDRDRQATLDAIRSSSRISRIAEEFGRWRRGGGSALRDLCNECSLNAPSWQKDRQVATDDPHSLSQVLSGALFKVMLETIAVGPTQRGLGGSPPIRDHFVRTSNRISSLLYKGLDWLPPGDAVFSDLVEAMLAADEYHFPDLEAERETLRAETARRGIPIRGDRTGGGPIDPSEMSGVDSDLKKTKRFISSHRALFGVPAGHAFEAATHWVRPVAEKRMWGSKSAGGGFDLDGGTSDKWFRNGPRVLVVKAAWWDTETNDLGPDFAETRECKSGSTVAIDETGRVRAVIRGGRAGSAEGRDAFLGRLAATGALVSGDSALGPDGEPIRGLFRVDSTNGSMRMTGGFQALHIADLL